LDDTANRATSIQLVISHSSLTLSVLHFMIKKTLHFMIKKTNLRRKICFSRQFNK